MDYQIAYLADHPEYAENVAGHVYKLWGRLIYEDTGMSVAQFVDVIRGRAVKDAVPLTLIALASGRLVGTVSLKQYETTTADGLSPWIGGLLVDEAWRSNGVGRALLTEAEASAVRQGYSWLHLSCEPDVQQYYARQGWELVDHRYSCGDEVALMRKTLLSDYVADA